MENLNQQYRISKVKCMLALSVGLLSACGGHNGGVNSSAEASSSAATVSSSSANTAGTASEASNLLNNAAEIVSTAANTIATIASDVTDTSTSDLNLTALAVTTAQESVDSTSSVASTSSSAKIQPGINLSYPKTGVTYFKGDKIGVGANAWDSDGDVTKVTFYANNKWIGRDTTRPYHLDWRGAAPGTYKVFAMAHDNNGLTKKSAVINVRVRAANSLNAPSVNLTSPGDVSTFNTGATITVKANASDSDGNVKKVDFYSNGTKLGSDWSAPYEYKWTSASAGSHDVYAVATDNDNLTAETNTHRVTVNGATTSTNKLVTYPVNSDINAIHKSNRFAVRVIQNGVTKNSFVYKENNIADLTWGGGYAYMQAANHWTSFSFANNVKVEARRLDGKAIQTCVVRPKSLKIQPTISGNKCIFNLTKAANVSVEIDENNNVSQYIDKIGNISKHIVKHPLFVFANPLETNIPSPGDANVVYFGPGIHEIGKNYLLPNNTTVYLAGGSYVIGTFRGKTKNASNITIRGRGILSGKGLWESTTETASWNNHAIQFVNGGGGKNLLIEGITITQPLRSCIISYSTTDVRNVKMFSWNHRNDGIAVGNGSIIEDSFIKVQDDNIKLYNSDQVIRNNVIWQQTSGSVFKFSWDLNRVAQNNSIYNIDIIHSNVFYDYPTAETDRPEFHSANAVFSAMGYSANAATKNNSFKWIRIEEENLLRLISLRMVSTHKTPYATSVWGNPSTSASKLIQNITIDDLSLGGIPWKKSTLYGNNGGQINKLWITNMRINGQVVPSKGQFTSRIDGVGIQQAGNVGNIIIKAQ